MESRLPIKSASIDATIDDLKKSLEISIWFNVNDLLVSYNCKEEEISYDETIFSLWLNCGVQ